MKRSCDAPVRADPYGAFAAKLDQRLGSPASDVVSITIQKKNGYQITQNIDLKRCFSYRDSISNETANWIRQLVASNNPQNSGG